MTQLPKLRVGQIWQCRQQDVIARVMEALAENAYSVDCQMAPASRQWSVNNGVRGLKREEGGYYKCPTGAKHCDFAHLLYDPPQ